MISLTKVEFSVLAIPNLIEANPDSAYGTWKVVVGCTVAEFSHYGVLQESSAENLCDELHHGELVITGPLSIVPRRVVDFAVEMGM